MPSRNYTIIAILVAIVVAGLGVWYLQDGAAVSVQQPAAQKLQTYVNVKYGFSFRYPLSLPKLTEYPGDSMECKKQDGFGDNDGLNSVVVAESNDNQFYAMVTCEPLTSAMTVYPAEDDQHTATKSVINGITIYSHEWTNAAGYNWTVLQFALDANHYAEIAYTFKNSPEPLPQNIELSSSDWDSITSSITVSNKPSAIAFSEQDLLGNWIDMANGQEIDFRTDAGKNVLSSYVDKQPEYVDCPWTLAGATVSINCPTIRDSFKIVSLTLNENLVIESEGIQFNFKSSPQI